MTNNNFNSELYAEMLQDEGIQYDSDIKSEMYNYLINQL